MSLEVSKRGQTSVHRRSGSSFNNSKRPALSNSGRRKMACSHNTDVRWAIITAPSNGDHLPCPGISALYRRDRSRNSCRLLHLKQRSRTGGNLHATIINVQTSALIANVYLGLLQVLSCFVLTFLYEHRRS